MTLQALPAPIYVPAPPWVSGTPALSGVTIDASGEKCAMVFRVTKTGNISKVGIRFHVVTTPQDIKLSLQDLDLATGDPDGVVDQSGVIASANVTANTFRLATLDSARSVTEGDRLVVVAEFNSTVGNVQITRWGQTAMRFPYLTNFTTSWAKDNSSPVLALEYDGGTYSAIPGVWPLSAITGVAFHSGSSPDERGLKFRLPFPCRVRGVWAHMTASAGGNFDAKLYDSDGSTVLKSVSVDGDEAKATGGSAAVFFWFASPQTLDADTFYRITLLPTTGTSVTLTEFDVASSAIMDALEGGQDFHHTSRVDAGAWTDTTTKRPFMGLIVDQLDDGAGGSETFTGSQLNRGLN